MGVSEWTWLQPQAGAREWNLPKRRKADAPGKLSHLHHFKSIGRGGEIRTPDPLLPKQMRYQAALRPDFPNYRTRGFRFWTVC